MNDRDDVTCMEGPYSALGVSSAKCSVRSVSSYGLRSARSGQVRIVLTYGT